MSPRCRAVEPLLVGLFVVWGVVAWGFIIASMLSAYKDFWQREVRMQPHYDPDAESKSRALLVSWLSPSQRQDFEDNNRFTVVGNVTGHAYEITAGNVYNVYRLDGGKRIEKICFLPPYTLGMNHLIHDIMLMQKIWLETDEDYVKRVANNSSIMADTPPPPLELPLRP